MQRALLCMTAVLGAGLPFAQDVVELKSGRKSEGVLLYESDEEVILRDGSRDSSIAREEVAEIRSRRGELERILRLMNEPHAATLNGLLELARLAEVASLEGEARILRSLALLEDPEQEEANEALGHRRRSGRWVVPHKGRFYTLDQLQELCADWGSAWEHETLHYKVRSNLDLRSTLLVALELERFYLAFYERLRPMLRIYECTEPMQIHLHGDAKSFPELGGQIAYFSAGERCLRILVAEEVDLKSLFHEATHQILYNVAVLERTNSGDVPDWLDEGLAEYMAAAAEGELGSVTFTRKTFIPAHFATQLRAEKPLSLGRVLNLRGSDFSSGSVQTLAYAQSYTLVHFCLEGGDDDFRKRFVDFMRGTFRGQSSSTHFKNAMGIEEDELERAWIEHVQNSALRGK